VLFLLFQLLAVLATLSLLPFLAVRRPPDRAATARSDCR
jgi:hypothetical protein